SYGKRAAPSGTALFHGSPARREGKRSVGLGELVQDGRVLQRGNVLGDGLVLCDQPQQATHDLAGTRLGQVLAETDLTRLGDRTDFAAHPIAQLTGDMDGFITL